MTRRIELVRWAAGAGRGADEARGTKKGKAPKLRISYRRHEGNDFTSSAKINLVLSQPLAYCRDMKNLTLDEARAIRCQTIRLEGVSGMIVSVDAAICLARERNLPPIITAGGVPVEV